MGEMRYWNYRVRRFTAFTNVPGVEPVEQFDIIEVHYDERDELVAWGNNIGPLGDTAADLRRDIEAMLAAFDKPTLDEENLPGASPGIRATTNDRGDVR